MNCQNLKSHLKLHVADLLLSPEQAPRSAHDHLAACSACRAELAGLKATIDGLDGLDGWKAPEVSPFFMTRFRARLREEQQRKPAGWLEQIGQRLRYGNHTLRPLAVSVLGVMVLLGGGIFAGLTTLSTQQRVVVPQSATLRDLQSLDENAQVFDQLSDLDQANAATAPSSAAQASGNL